MFAAKPAQKLGEGFDTLVKSEDTRGGTSSAPVTDRLDPDTTLFGQAHTLLITQSGGSSGEPTTASTSTLTVKNPDKSVTAVRTTYDLTVGYTATVNTAL